MRWCYCWIFSRTEKNISSLKVQRTALKAFLFPWLVCASVLVRQEAPTQKPCAVKKKKKLKKLKIWLWCFGCDRRFVYSPSKRAFQTFTVKYFQDGHAKYKPGICEACQAAIMLPRLKTKWGSIWLSSVPQDKKNGSRGQLYIISDRWQLGTWEPAPTGCESEI